MNNKATIRKTSNHLRSKATMGALALSLLGSFGSAYADYIEVSNEELAKEEIINHVSEVIPALGYYNSFSRITLDQFNLRLAMRAPVTIETPMGIERFFATDSSKHTEADFTYWSTSSTYCDSKSALCFMKPFWSVKKREGEAQATLDYDDIKRAGVTIDGTVVSFAPHSYASQSKKGDKEQVRGAMLHTLARRVEKAMMLKFTEFQTPTDAQDELNEWRRKNQTWQDKLVWKLGKTSEGDKQIQSEPITFANGSTFEILVTPDRKLDSEATIVVKGTHAETFNLFEVGPTIKFATDMGVFGPSMEGSKIEPPPAHTEIVEASNVVFTRINGQWTIAAQGDLPLDLNDYALTAMQGATNSDALVVNGADANQSGDEWKTMTIFKLKTTDQIGVQLYRDISDEEDETVWIYLNKKGKHVDFVTSEIDD